MRRRSMHGRRFGRRKLTPAFRKFLYAWFSSTYVKDDEGKEHLTIPRESLPRRYWPTYKTIAIAGKPVEVLN